MVPSRTTTDARMSATCYRCLKPLKWDRKKRQWRHVGAPLYHMPDPFYDWFWGRKFLDDE